MNLSILEMLNKKFAGKKTYIVAIATVLGTLSTYFLGEITLLETLQLVVPAVIGATLKHGQTTGA